MRVTDWLTGVLGLILLPFVLLIVIVLAAHLWAVRIFWDITEGGFEDGQDYN